MSKVKFTFEGDSNVLLALLGLAKMGDEGEDGELEPEPEKLNSSVLTFPPSAPPLTEAPSPAPQSGTAALQSLVQAAQQRAAAEQQQQRQHFGTTTTLPNAMVPDTTGLDNLTPAVSGAHGLMSAGGQADKFGKFDFGALPLKDEAWDTFQEFIDAWMVNFNGPVDEDQKPLTPQPDRLEMLRLMGSCRWTIYILRWIAHYKCLQGAVRKALKTDDLDLVDKVSTTIVQVSHMAFPDIAEFYDNSTRWRRA